jgi:hypothetical protein
VIPLSDIRPSVVMLNVVAPSFIYLVSFRQSGKKLRMHHSTMVNALNLEVCTVFTKTVCKLCAMINLLRMPHCGRDLSILGIIGLPFLVKNDC